MDRTGAYRRGTTSKWHRSARRTNVVGRRQPKIRSHQEGRQREQQTRRNGRNGARKVVGTGAAAEAACKHRNTGQRTNARNNQVGRPGIQITGWIGGRGMGPPVPSEGQTPSAAGHAQRTRGRSKTRENSTGVRAKRNLRAKYRKRRGRQTKCKRQNTGAWRATRGGRSATGAGTCNSTVGANILPRCADRRAPAARAQTRGTRPNDRTGRQAKSTTGEGAVQVRAWRAGCAVRQVQQRGAKRRKTAGGQGNVRAVRGGTGQRNVRVQRGTPRRAAARKSTTPARPAGSKSKR